MALSGNAAIPAVDSRRRVMAHLSGRRIVQMVKDDLKPSDIMTREAFENAIRTNGAIGGSTNAVIHLACNRWAAWASISRWTTGTGSVGTFPTIVNLMPSGEYLMEEFFYAGGLPVVIKRQLAEAGLLHKACPDGVQEKRSGIRSRTRQNWNEDVIPPLQTMP